MLSRNRSNAYKAGATVRAYVKAHPGITGLFLGVALAGIVVPVVLLYLVAGVALGAVAGYVL